MISCFTKWLIVSLLSLPFLLHAQEQATNIVYTTGGSFNAAGNRVEVFAMHPDSTNPQVLFAEFGDFSNAVVADHRFVYAHIGRGASNPSGKDVIIRYDLIEGVVVDSADASGLQRMAVNDQYLVVTRGFGADSNYVLVFDKYDLAQGPVYQDQALSAFTRAVAVSDDRAFVGYDENGRGTVASFSLMSSGVQYLQSYPIDSSAGGIGSLFFHGNGLVGQAEVTSFPPPNFMEVVVSKAVFRLDTANGLFTTDTSVARSNSAVGLVGDFLYGNYGGGIQGYDLSAVTPTYSDTIFKDGITAGVFNRVDSAFAFQETDYFSFGRMALVPYADPLMVSNIATPVSGSAIDVAYNNPPEGDFIYLFVPMTDTVDLKPFLSDVDGDSVRVTWLEAAPSGQTLTLLPDGRVAYSAPVTTDVQYAIEDDFGATDTNRLVLDFSASLQQQLPTFSLYPNPVHRELVIEFAASYSYVFVEILSLQGQRILETQYAQPDRAVIPVDRLSPGMYVVRVRNEEGVMTKRFVKR